MTMEFTTSSQCINNTGVKVLLYGPSGSGKTLLCATAPRPMIINAENKLLSLNPANQQRVYGKVIDIPVMTIHSLDEFKAAYTFCLTDPYMANIDTICMDSLSDIAEAVLRSLLPNYKDPRKAYGEMASEITGILTDFRNNINKNMYFITKQEKIVDGATGALVFGPSFPGKQLADGSPYIFDEVFNLNVGKSDDGKTYRYIRTQPDPQYTAKDSSGALLEIETPHLTTIINKINNQ